MINLKIRQLHKSKVGHAINFGIIMTIDMQTYSEYNVNKLRLYNYSN